MQKGVKRHGCSSHGVAVTPEKRGLVVRWPQRARAYPRRDRDAAQAGRLIKLRDQPVIFRHGWPQHFRQPVSDRHQARKIVAALTDEEKRVAERKVAEVVMSDGKVVRTATSLGLKKR